jgi:hypothetical protein
MSLKIVVMAALCSLSLWSVNVVADVSAWRTDGHGWVLRKMPGEKNFQKFFAVGLWNIPGYTREAMEKDTELYRRSAQPYLARSENYNMVYLPPGTGDVAGKRVEVVGSVGFYEALRACQTSISSSEAKDRDYQERHYLEQEAESPKFIGMLDRTIDGIISLSAGSDHIWAPIDEIVGGGAGNGWCWSARVGRAIRKRILRREPHGLVFTDLVGISRGNSYLFEHRYLQTHHSMPATPPYEALGVGAKRLPERPLLGFVQAYDGSPVYVNGTADYVDYDLPTLRRFFYENLKICAHDYQSCGDVFGINSFIDCNNYPVLAGVAVDGIKAGVGAGTPVWIFFDGNGYAQPAGQDVNTFVKNLKCQMYTSIIHGATGVMFWNDRSLSPDVFNALEPVVREISQQIPLFRGKTIRTHFEGDVHYMVKRVDGKGRVLIAANTSPSEVASLDFNSLHISLQPFEVLVKNL